MFTNKKRERIDTCVCAVSLYVAETPKASIMDQEPPLPIIPFGIVAYGSKRSRTNYGCPLSSQFPPQVTLSKRNSSLAVRN